ncbi:hypothetical protein F4V57_03765 [Acinetobacter qingfengensis]|uniref:Uncharacterized protein n=1 Tax=Acinetobacter qingfengensis TaxID=1262585 RepID=A0A1E7RCP6_9GAMM|nr:hypothetical protein [Acinetobacter qingfengensis]KAA8734885.1 hypothetical protein F4V57_03765 [Acinetobacter qingfengensis]OEY96945.1 hypothetical protein BJI46_11730 [Acinetobacter qingfengensis]
MSENSTLNYVAHLIIESFRENGLDEPYIAEKTQQFLSHQSKGDSLYWACNFLDRKNLATFAEKLGVTVDMLRVTAKVLSKI